MFNLFKSNPLTRLQKEYAAILEQAMHAQRNGRIDLYAKLSAQAESILEKIEEIEKMNGLKQAQN